MFLIHVLPVFLRAENRAMFLFFLRALDYRLQQVLPVALLLQVGSFPGAKLKNEFPSLLFFPLTSSAFSSG